MSADELKPETPKSVAMPQDRSKKGGDVLGSSGSDARSAMNPAEIKTRLEQYLITARQGSSLHPMAASDMTFDVLQSMEGVKVLKRIKPSGITTLSTMGNTGDVIVAETTSEKGLELRQTANRDLIVEPNSHLIHLGVTPQFSSAQPDLPPAFVVGIPVQIQVLSPDGSPLPHVALAIFGRSWPQQGETDTDGKATLTVFGGPIDTVVALYVKPASGFWERWIVSPALDPKTLNTLIVRPLEAFRDSGFPGAGKPFIGWGQKLMGLEDARSAGITGKDVRIAVIDSGCDNTHPALSHIRLGKDLTVEGNPFLDREGHGTHCVGVIAGNGRDGILGFAPEAEVHVLKLFPGGRFDDLISALAYCIDNRIDIVNCSLGADQTSEAVQQRIEQARQAGVAVIVAAGNSSGGVQFPAQLPTVLSVAAIGQEGEFPADTYHAQTVSPNPSLTAKGIFAAKFTCNGPQIKVCGPGVAVISTVPGGGYAAWDGTSMAAPHLTGLAALALASHPEIQNAARTSARVDKLFELLMRGVDDLGLPRDYEGAGLPALKRIFSPTNKDSSPVTPLGSQTVQSERFIADLAALAAQTILSVINSRPSASQPSVPQIPSWH